MSRIGDQDREVLIQQLTTDAAGTSGFPVETWADLAVVWMEKVQMTESERFRTAQLTAPMQTRWRLWFRDDMDPNAVDVVKRFRLVYGGRVHDITAAIEIGRGERLELTTLAASGVDA